MKTALVIVSVTELPHFERLVEFLAAVEDLGRVNADEELQDLVDACRHDLQDLAAGDWPGPDE